MSVSDVAPERSGRRAHPALITVALILAVAAFQIAATMILPALPAVGKGVGASDAQLSLAQSLFYAIGGLSAVSLPLSDRFGRRKSLVFVLGLGILGSILVAVSGSLALFLVGRILEAPGVVALPLAFLIIRENVSEDKFPLYIGVLSALNLGVTGVDGLIAGWLTDTVGFQAIFWVAAAVGAVAIGFVWAAVPQGVAVRHEPADWVGVIVIGVGVLAVSIGLAQGGSWGWGSPATLVLLIGGILFLAGFVLVERSRRHPLVKVGQLRRRRVWSVPLVVLLSMGGFMSVFALVMPIWAQLPVKAGGFGMSATQYALAAIPGTILAFLAAPAVGAIARKTGWRPVLIVGVGVAALSMVGLALSMALVLPAFVFFTLSAIFFSGVAMTATNALGVLLSPAESPAFLPGIVSVSYSFGSSFGTAISGSVIGAAAGAAAGFIGAAIVAAGLIVVGALLAFLVPRLAPAVREAAQTVKQVAAQ